MSISEKPPALSCWDTIKICWRGNGPQYLKDQEWIRTSHHYNKLGAHLLVNEYVTIKFPKSVCCSRHPYEFYLIKQDYKNRVSVVISTYQPNDDKVIEIAEDVLVSRAKVHKD